MSRFLASLGFVLLIVVAVGGCGRSTEEKQYAWNMMALIGSGYQTAQRVVGHFPENVEELIEGVKANGADDWVYDAIRADNSQKYVIIYGVDVTALHEMARQADTIIAYETITPTQGGYVVMANFTVVELTAEEFKTATLAKGK